MELDLNCRGNDVDGWEHTHTWVSSMMYVDGWDVAEVAESRPDVACEACDRTYVDLASA
jgi:hypothetical protein